MFMGYYVLWIRVLIEGCNRNRLTKIAIDAGGQDYAQLVALPKIRPIS